MHTYMHACMHTYVHTYILRGVGREVSLGSGNPLQFSMHDTVALVILHNDMLNENTWGVKKCGANQKQHCKQAGVTKRFDIS